MEKTNYEKRELSTLPVFQWENLTTYASEVENYINDHLPFRNQMIRLNSMLRYSIFHSSTDNRVVLGKEGWLFYNDRNDGNPIEQYKGYNLFTDNELEVIAKNLSEMKETLAKEERDFVLFIAPNKERVYSEYMPEYYGEPAETYAVLQVVEYLQEHTDIKVVYPYDELVEAKHKLENEILYYQKDTHWNQLGAYIGIHKLLGELDIQIPSIYDDKVIIEERNSTQRDLADMLNLGERIDIGREYSILGYVENEDLEVVKNEFLGEIIYKNPNVKSKKLFVCRDSFGTVSTRVLASKFNESVFLHRFSYEGIESIKKYNPDVVVYEVVERYIRELLNLK